MISSRNLVSAPQRGQRPKTLAGNGRMTKCPSKSQPKDSAPDFESALWCLKFLQKEIAAHALDTIRGPGGDYSIPLALRPSTSRSSAFVESSESQSSTALKPELDGQKSAQETKTPADPRKSALPPRIPTGQFHSAAPWFSSVASRPEFWR
jgi:hypothetical protein